MPSPVEAGGWDLGTSLWRTSDMTENQMASALLVTLSSPRSPISEAYRTLRTNLQFVCLDKPLRSLLVTSAGPEEGKSTMLANLAVAMAQGEKKVILVDCD